MYILRKTLGPVPHGQGRRPREEPSGLEDVGEDKPPTSTFQGTIRMAPRPRRKRHIFGGRQYNPRGNG